jgi:hypothetical protein
LPQSRKVTGDWRKLHNEELHDLYFETVMASVFNSMNIMYVGHVAHVERKRDAYRGLEEEVK